MGGAGTSPPPRRPAATRGAVGARGAYVTCQVSIQVCFEIYSRFETQMFVSSGEVRDLILESLEASRRGARALRRGGLTYSTARPALGLAVRPRYAAQGPKLWSSFKLV